MLWIEEGDYLIVIRNRARSINKLKDYGNSIFEPSTYMQYKLTSDGIFFYYY